MIAETQARTVLFVCVHNSGRSQMARALFDVAADKAGLSIRAESAGTMPGKGVNPMAAEAMREIGISIDDAKPQLLTQAMVDRALRVITMGCGVDADACPARIFISEDWGLDDPAGQPLEAVRPIRDQIAERVAALITELQTQQSPNIASQNRKA